MLRRLFGAVLFIVGVGIFVFGTGGLSIPEASGKVAGAAVMAIGLALAFAGLRMVFERHGQNVAQRPSAPAIVSKQQVSPTQQNSAGGMFAVIGLLVIAAPFALVAFVYYYATNGINSAPGGYGGGSDELTRACQDSMRYSAFYGPDAKNSPDDLDARNCRVDKWVMTHHEGTNMADGSCTWKDGHVTKSTCEVYRCQGGDIVESEDGQTCPEVARGRR